MFLAIDSSTRYAGLALAGEWGTIASLNWRSQGSHTVELMPAIHWLLQRAGMEAQEIKGIGVALGPGSFSALRVGMSVAKGMAVALQSPLVGVGTLEMEAYGCRSVGMPLCPILEVGKNMIAWAMFRWLRGAWRQELPEQTGSLEELFPHIRGRTLFCGEGAPGLAAVLKQGLGRKLVTLGSYTPALRLEALVELGIRRLGAYDEKHIAALQPLYLRHPSITAAKESTT